MKTHLLLFLLVAPLAVKSQCPDPDSILKSRAVFNPYPYPPYSIIGHPGIFTWTWTNYPPSPPPVNQDPKTGKTYWHIKGKCSIIYPDIEDSVLLAKGQYLNGKKTGTWTWYHQNGNKLAEGSYTNGLKTGIWKEWNEDGTTLSTGNFTGGRKEGNWKEYLIDVYAEPTTTTITASINYHKGLHHGTTVNYHLNGFISESYSYYNGMQHGYSRSYSEEGKITASSYYVKGLITGRSITYFENGQISAINTYLNGQQHGPTTTYDYDGNVISIDTYKNGQQHGWSKRFADKELKEKIWYVNGKKNGLHWTYDGYNKTVMHYKENVLHGTYKVYNKRDSLWILMEACRYNNDMKDSLHFYASYSSKIFTPYVKNKVHGTKISINDSGDTVEYAEYFMDTLHGKRFAVNGPSKTYSFYNKGKRVYEKNYMNGVLQQDMLFRHDMPYDKRFSKELEDGTILESLYQPDGKTLMREHRFSPENQTPSLHVRSFYPNGKIMTEYTLVDGKFSGQKIHFTQEGDTSLYSEYVDGRQHGYSSQCSDNMVQRGFYKDDVREGPWSMWYTIKGGKKLHSDSLQLAARGEMYKNEPFGKWNYYYPNGQLRYAGCVCGAPYYPPATFTYSGYAGINYPTYPIRVEAPNYQMPSYLPFPTGVFCGNYTEFYPEGSIYKRKQHDTINEYYKNGSLYNYTNGTFYIQYDTSGNIIKAHMPDTTVYLGWPGGGDIQTTRENKKLRTIQTVNDKGQLTSYERVDLVKHTYVKRTWNNNGRLSSFDSSDIHLKYFEDGHLQYAYTADSMVSYHKNKNRWTYWVNGKNDNVWTTYYENGNKMAEYPYHNKRQGDWHRTYHDDGSLWKTTFYNNLVKTGEETTYFRSGKIMKIETFENGQLNGETKEFDENGNLLSVKKYHLGKEVK